MALMDLVGNVAPSGPIVGERWWSKVDEWTLGGNDKYGDCAFVSLCNLQDLLSVVRGKPFVIEEAEAEYFYNVEAGFNSQDLTTDKGAVLAEVIKYWADKGWPSDPADRPIAWSAIGPRDIHLAVDKLYGVPAWCQLPEGDDPDFTDDALAKPAADGHAVLIVGSDPTGLTIITWAAPVHVSAAWWNTFGRGQFGIKFA